MATPESGNKNRQRLPKPDEIKTGSKEEVSLLENKLGDKITQLLPDIKAEHLPLLKKALAEMLLSAEDGSTEIEFRKICDWDLGGKVVRIRPAEFKQFVEEFYNALFPKENEEQAPTVAEPVATHQSKDAPLELQEKIETNKDALLREEVFLHKLELKDSEIKKYLAEVEAALAELEKGDKVESFSKEQIKEQMEALLKENEATAEKIDIQISNGKIVINITGILAKGNKVKGIELKLKNKEGVLEYESYTTHDNPIKKGLVAGFLGSKIKNAPEELENYIQENYKRGVKKIWIEGDELKVEFVDSRMSGDTLGQRSLLIPRRNELLAAQEQSDIHIEQQRKLLTDLELEKSELGLELEKIIEESVVMQDTIDYDAELRRLDAEIENDELEIAFWEAELKKIDKAIEEDDAEITLLENMLKENQEQAQVINETKEKEPDDLTKIPGISPVIQTILNKNGIETYGQLAKTTVGGLQEALNSHNGPIWIFDGEMKDWPEHASILAKGGTIPEFIIEPIHEKSSSVSTENNEKGEFFGNFTSCSKDGSFSLENKGKGDIYTIHKKGNLYYASINGNGSNVRRLLSLPETFIEPVNQALNAYNPKATSVNQIKPAILRLEGQKLVLVERGDIWYNGDESHEDYVKGQAEKADMDVKAMEALEKHKVETVENIAKDDLTVIEGIGPKIQKLLNENGIFTYKDLAQTGVGRLREILDSAGAQLAMHDPTSWPAQANFAANEMWEELTSIQTLVPKNDSKKDKDEKNKI